MKAALSRAQFESCIVELNRKLPFLESLVLIFNNPKQQLQQCHLDALSKLSNLRSLAVKANMSPTNVTFAPLADLEYLAELRLIQTEYSTGLTDAHVESLSELYSLEVLEFPGHASSFKGACWYTCWYTCWANQAASCTRSPFTPQCMPHTQPSSLPLTHNRHTRPWQPHSPPRRSIHLHPNLRQPHYSHTATTLTPTPY
jgi:hypothetical protein